MKRHILIAVMFACMAITQPVKAQVSVNVNIGLQPLWGPVGYDYVEYYYLPDYGVYYYVPDARFVYFSGGQWIFAPALPPSFGVINFYSCYKVVINQPKAYLYYNTHKVKYVGYKGKGSKQVVIRDSREPKYYVVKGHPSYGKQATPKAASKSFTPANKSKQQQPVYKNNSYRTSPAPGNPGRGNSSPGGSKGHGGGGHGKGGGKNK